MLQQWVNHENPMLSERNQTKKATYYDSTHMKNPEQPILQKQKVELWLPGPCGRKGEYLLLNRMKVSVQDDEKVLEIHSSDRCIGM